MPKKKIFMIIVAMCWVVVLAFGPRTMTPTNQSSEKEKSSDEAKEESRYNRDKEEKAAHAPEDIPQQQPEPVVPTPSTTDVMVPEELYPQFPEPVIVDPVVPSPILRSVVPVPELPKIPPVCGGCGGQLTQDNGLTIRCPMNEISSPMVCLI